MATQNSLPPFFSPFSPPSQPTAVVTKFPGIKYEGNTVFEDRERKVGIKVTDIAADSNIYCLQQSPYAQLMFSVQIQMFTVVSVQLSPSPCIKRKTSL